MGVGERLVLLTAAAGFEGRRIDRIHDDGVVDLVD
jgi:hypothetical protein